LALHIFSCCKCHAASIGPIRLYKVSWQLVLDKHTQVEQGSETAIIALQYNIPTTIRMKLTSAPIVAFNESINDDTEIRRRIGDGQC